MEKAYDLKALGQKLQEQGLPIVLDAAESAAGKVYVAVKEWIQESAALSESKIDDVIAPALNYLDPIVLPQIDKINGKVG